MSRLAGAVLAFTLACGGDWLTGPGTPLQLSHESLEGRWVEVLVVSNTSTAVYRNEYSSDEGEIVQFDGAGGVQHFRYPPNVTYAYLSIRSVATP